MKIATYNVNGINARLPVLLRWLEASQPDVVCLQELKAPHDKIPYQAIRDAGYQAIWHGQKSWNGVAILSKRGEPLEVRRVLPGDPVGLLARSQRLSEQDVSAYLGRSNVTCLSSQTAGGGGMTRSPGCPLSARVISGSGPFGPGLKGV